MSNNAKGSKKVLIVVVVVLIACLILILLPSSVFERKSDTIPTLSGGATVSTQEGAGRLNKDYSSGDVEYTLPSLTTAVERSISVLEQERLDAGDAYNVPDSVKNFIMELDPARVDMSWVRDLEYRRLDCDYPLVYGKDNGFMGLVDVISKDCTLNQPRWAYVFGAVFLGYVGGDNRGFCAFSLDLSEGLDSSIVILRQNLPNGYIVGDTVDISFTTNNSRVLTIDGIRVIVGE